MFALILNLCLAAAPQTPRYAELPVAVSSFGACVSGEWIYLYGGHSGKTHTYSTEAVTGRFFRIPIKGGKWEELTAGPALQGTALVAHKGKIYRIAGMQPRNKPGTKTDNHSLASCACYDPATKKWQALPHLPAPRSSHDAVVVGDKVYVVGGWTMNGAGKKSVWLDKMVVMDLSQKKPKWDHVDQPFKRRALQTVEHEGKVVVLGGLDAAGKVSRKVESFDPKSGKWSSLPQLPGFSRNGFSPAACVAAGKLYVSVSDGTVYRLSEKKTDWDEVTSLKQKRVVHRMVLGEKGQLVVLGGGAKEGNVKQVEVIDLTAKP